MTPARILFIFIAIIFSVWCGGAIERYRIAKLSRLDPSLHFLDPTRPVVNASLTTANVDNTANHAQLLAAENAQLRRDANKMRAQLERLAADVAGSKALND
jgi:hypothetical protein